MRSYTSLITKSVGLLAALLISFSVSTAQPYTVVNGWQGAGAQTTSSYTYFYNYPNEYYYIFGYSFMYDYMDRAYQEFIVTAADMKAAGLCAGPIDAMSLRSIRNPINWTLVSGSSSSPSTQ